MCWRISLTFIHGAFMMFLLSPQVFSPAPRVLLQDFQLHDLLHLSGRWKTMGSNGNLFGLRAGKTKKCLKKKADSRTILLKGIPNYTCGNYIPTSKPNSKTPLKMDGDWRRWTFLFLMPAFLGVLAAVSFRELKRDWNEESLKRSVPNIGDLQGTCPTQQHQPPLPSPGGLLHMVRSTLGTPKDGPWPPFT